MRTQITAEHYVWNNGVVNGTAFTPLLTKKYTVEGKDGNNCSDTASITITVDPLNINAYATDLFNWERIRFL